MGPPLPPFGTARSLTHSRTRNTGFLRALAAIGGTPVRVMRWESRMPRLLGAAVIRLAALERIPGTYGYVSVRLRKCRAELSGTATSPRDGTERPPSLTIFRRIRSLKTRA